MIFFVFKGHSRAGDYAAALDGKQIVVSSMTVAQLKRWALKKRWGASRIAKLDQQLRQVIVYPVDLDLCRLPDMNIRERRPVRVQKFSFECWRAAKLQFSELVGFH